MATTKVLIGKEDEKNKVVFEKPPRTNYIYFGKDEGAAFGAGICHIPPHSSNERHSHDSEDEIMYVLSGQVRFNFPHQEKDHVLSPGEAIYVPKGIVHQLFNDTDEKASHSWTFTPAGQEVAIRNKYYK